MSASTPTAVDIIARRFYEAGCRLAFGIPGGEVLSMVDALTRAGIRFVLTKHENGAGFMAEGVYSSTGAPGILVATLGPGVANAATVVANAEQDRVPLIFLTGCVDDADLLSYPHQIFDHAQLLAPITKASFRLSDGTADVLADKALAVALGGRPGPVHIDLPVSAARAVFSKTECRRHAPPAAVAPAPGPALDQARRWLSESHRPLMIAGMDVLHHTASESAVRFAERFGVPLITTYKAKGVLPEDHALSLGGAGLSPAADRHLLPLVEAADLIILAGYDPIEMRTGWRNVWDPSSKQVIEFAAVPNDHYMHQATLNFVCHVGTGLDSLADGPAAVVSTVRGVLARDGIATVDSGAHRILQTQMWECYMPHTLLQSVGLGAMGCALPLAIGAKLALPDRQVLCFTGDAGLEMIMGELATLRDLKLAIPIVVFADASLALIELKQRAMKLDSVGVDFDATDFVALGRALGGRGVAADSREALDRELREAFQADTFTIISCPIDGRAYDGRI
jgi:acetolactate synthase-1/2/3 large subunit